MCSEHLFYITDSVMSTPADFICLSRPGASTSDINDVVHQIEVVEPREWPSRWHPQTEFSAPHEDTGDLVDQTDIVADEFQDVQTGD